MKTTLSTNDHPIFDAIADTPFEDTDAWKRIIRQLRLTRPEREQFARDLRKLLEARSRQAPQANGPPPASGTPQANTKTTSGQENTP